MRKIYNKLVRDRIPEIIEKDGKTAITSRLSLGEYQMALDAKLGEEVKEYAESLDIHELADVQEVINAIVKAKGMTLEEFDAIPASKAQTNGAFDNRILLEAVDDKK